jgi:hypothetical protein
MRRPLFLAAAAALFGCGNAEPTGLGGIQQLIYIQRTGGETGNVFEYAQGGAATDQGDIYLLAPPTASGTRTNLTHLPPGSDVMAMDLSFDAAEVVFSARLAPGDPYHLFRINLDGSNPCEPGSTGYCQITDGPNDEVYPIYIPGGRIFFVTNRCVESGAKQFEDEYERATTAQVATISRMGGDLQLGARNVSHRVAPTLLSDGRVLLTQWDHLGEKNEGNLVIMSQDMTAQREGFGKEGKGVTNSYLRAREVAPGQLVSVGTSRDRTFQAGKLLLVALGTLAADGTVDMSSLAEANSSAEDLTPDVPGGRTASYAGVGRYFDAFPVGDLADRRFVVSWADGPVESMALGAANQKPLFGIYLYDAKAKSRFPIVVLQDAWAVSPIPVQKRAEPAIVAAGNMAQGTQSTLVSAINVYDSTLFQIPQGSVRKVRIMEGFSGEEGVGDFGLTEFDGHARLGEIDPAGDGSFKALVPANVPVHIQLVDDFAMAVQTGSGDVASEPIWIQGRAGEARVCGGCHEDRTKTPSLTPGSSALQALGAVALDLPRPQRMSMDFSPAKVMGVPWDLALQPIFDAHCTDCHDGSANGANPHYTITDMTDMLTFDWTFDLRGQPINANIAGRMYGYSASHLSLIGPAMLFEEKQITITGDMPKQYISPGAARASMLFQLLNPPQRYPTIDTTRRAYAGPVHPAEVATAINGHSGSDAKYQLSPDEYYLLILMADMGGQFYSRENIYAARGGH